MIEAGDEVAGIRGEVAGIRGEVVGVREEVVGLGDERGRLAVAIRVVGVPCSPSCCEETRADGSSV